LDGVGIKVKGPGLRNAGLVGMAVLLGAVFFAVAARIITYLGAAE